ncbi:hypothetical protein I5G43_32600, partial [Pseudomonas aeruginosa]|nr:hypothetical protein [Pseudomonas aeruginosa]
MTWRPWLVVALVTALVFWRMDHLAQDREAEQRRAEAAETERDRKQQMIDLQAAVEQSADTITAMAQQAQRDTKAQAQADALARTYQAALQ